jgi:uncharacterized membrane protein
MIDRGLTADQTIPDELHPGPRQGFDRRYWVGLAIILGLGAFFRIYELGTPSVWIDEISSIEIAMGRGTAHDAFPAGIIRVDQPYTLDLNQAAPWWDIWNHTQITTHPPLYFIALRWWMDLFGNRPAGTRTLSVLCSLAGIVVLFDVCRILQGERVALLAAAIMALALGQLDIAQEARSYPMLILIGLGCCDLVVRAEKFGADWPRYSAIAILLAAMLLTHYFAAAGFVALGIYTILRFHGRERARMLITFAIAAAIAIAAWGPQFYLQTINVPDPNPSYVRERFHNHIVQSLIRAAQLPADYLCGFNLSRALPIAVHVVVVGIVIALVVRAAMRRDQLLWVLWICGIVGSIFTLDILHGSAFLYYTRYTVLASPALFAIIAGTRMLDLRYIRYLVQILLIALLLRLAAIRAHRGVPPTQDFRQLAAIIDQHSAPDELLIFTSDSGWVTGGLRYLGYKYYSPDSHHPWLKLDHPADANVMSQIGPRQSVWMIGLNPKVEGPIYLPGWRVALAWPTTPAGGVCLLQPGR